MFLLPNVTVSISIKCSFIFLCSLSSMVVSIKAQTKAPTKAARSSPRARDPRFFYPFSLFNIVQFSNEECDSSTGLKGTCYTGTECSELGGTKDGSCAR